MKNQLEYIFNIEDHRNSIDQIAIGMFEIIQKAGQANVLSYGMVPNWAIAPLESGLKNKLKSLSNKEIKAFVHEVVLSILNKAKKEGVMVV